jgi:hypothetical protein
MSQKTCHSFGMAKVVSLVHPEEALSVSTELLVAKCHLFADHLLMSGAVYTLKSQVRLADFREFVSALKGTQLSITDENFRGLSKLSTEFGFHDLSVQLSETHVMSFPERNMLGTLVFGIGFGSLILLLVKTRNFMKIQPPTTAFTRFFLLCRMVQPRSAHSTRRDVAVATVLFRHVHLKVNLRLLRSTGCLARILILAEEGHPIDREFRTVIGITGAELIYNSPEVFEKRLRLHQWSRMNFLISMVRHEWFRSWLENHLAELDRVFVYEQSIPRVSKRGRIARP